MSEPIFENLTSDPCNEYSSKGYGVEGRAVLVDRENEIVQCTKTPSPTMSPSSETNEGDLKAKPEPDDGEEKLSYEAVKSKESFHDDLHLAINDEGRLLNEMDGYDVKDEIEMPGEIDRGKAVEDKDQQNVDHSDLKGDGNDCNTKDSGSIITGSGRDIDFTDSNCDHEANNVDSIGGKNNLVTSECLQKEGNRLELAEEEPCENTTDLSLAKAVTPGDDAAAEEYFEVKDLRIDSFLQEKLEKCVEQPELDSDSGTKEQSRSKAVVPWDQDGVLVKDDGEKDPELEKNGGKSIEIGDDSKATETENHSQIVEGKGNVEASKEKSERGAEEGDKEGGEKGAGGMVSEVESNRNVSDKENTVAVAKEEEHMSNAKVECHKEIEELQVNKKAAEAEVYGMVGEKEDGVNVTDLKDHENVVCINPSDCHSLISDLPKCDPLEDPNGLVQTRRSNNVKKFQNRQVTTERERTGADKLLQVRDDKKEASIDKKIAAIRKKNEERLRRLKEIEEDKANSGSCGKSLLIIEDKLNVSTRRASLEGEQKGDGNVYLTSASGFKTASTKYEPQRSCKMATGPSAIGAVHDSVEEEGNVQASNDVDIAAIERDRGCGRGRGDGRGDGRGGGRNRGRGRSRSGTKDESVMVHRRSKVRGRGEDSRGDRRAQLREEERLKNIREYEATLKEISLYEDAQMDGSSGKEKTEKDIRKEREAALKETRKERHSYHVRGHRTGKTYPQFRNSQTDSRIHITGKERQIYDEWKSERDRIEAERIGRLKEASGKWRRDWDKDKEWDEGNAQWVPPKGK